MLGEVEVLEALEQRVAQVVLHVERDSPTHEPADERGTEAEEPGRDQQGDPRRDRAIGRADHVVDDDLLHDRRERGYAHPRDRRAEGDEHLRTVRGDKGQEPANPAAVGRWLDRHPRSSFRLAGRVMHSGTGQAR